MTSWIVVAHESLQGRALRARRQPHRERVRLERHLLDLRAPVRRADVRQRRHVARVLAVDVREGHRDAAARSSTPRTTSAATSSRASTCSRCCGCSGKEVEMLRFPAESHELSRAGSPLHRVQRFEAILEWFGRYLVARHLSGRPLPAVPVDHRVERLAPARLEVRPDRVGDRDQRDLHHLVVRDAEDLRRLAARASGGRSSRRCRARASGRRA